MSRFVNQKKKGAGINPAPMNALRRMRVREAVLSEKTYLLSATDGPGVPKSRRLLTAVRAARVAGWFAAAAP